MRPFLTAAAVLALALPAAAAQDEHPLGEARDDLDRFYGEYGTPGDGAGRDYRVAPAEAPVWAERLDIPEGYLMLIPLWGDGQHWYFASIGDTRFEQRLQGDFGTKTVVRFETGPDGRATAMVFEAGSDRRDRVERLRDLPQ